MSRHGREPAAPYLRIGAVAAAVAVLVGQLLFGDNGASGVGASSSGAPSSMPGSSSPASSAPMSSAPVSSAPASSAPVSSAPASSPRSSPSGRAPSSSRPGGPSSPASVSPSRSGSRSPVAGSPRGARASGAPARSAPELPAAGSPYLVLDAASLDATRLVYLGTVTVSRPTGTVQALRFTLQRGLLTAPAFVEACSSQATTTAVAADSANLSSTTFDAISLAGTVNGVRTIFTVTDPPTAPFPQHLVLHDLVIEATTVSSAQLSMSGSVTGPASC